MADARSAHVEVPPLDATLLQLQVELHAMKVASQQAQERTLRLESELSTAQDRIGAAESKAAQAERRQSSLQKCMDDWDAFDPDLHAALQASVTLQLQVLRPSQQEQPHLPNWKKQFNLHIRCKQQQEQDHWPNRGMDLLCRQAHPRLKELPSSHLCIRHKDLHNRCNLHQLETLKVLWTVPVALM